MKEYETTVHRWKSKSEYFDVDNGEEISKQLAKRDYNIIRTHKNIKIENHEGQINWVHECERKRQLSIWRD